MPFGRTNTRMKKEGVVREGVFASEELSMDFDVESCQVVPPASNNNRTAYWPTTIVKSNGLTNMSISFQLFLGNYSTSSFICIFELYEVWTNFEVLKNNTTRPVRLLLDC